MLLLVGSYRHHIRLVKQNVRRHQNRIGEQPRVYIVHMPCGLVLKLGHAGKLAKLGIAAEKPRKLRVGGHLALDKQQALLRVNAAREQNGIGADNLLAELRRSCRTVMACRSTTE